MEFLVSMELLPFFNFKGKVKEKLLARLLWACPFLCVHCTGSHTVSGWLLWSFGFT